LRPVFALPPRLHDLEDIKVPGEVLYRCRIGDSQEKQREQQRRAQHRAELKRRAKRESHRMSNQPNAP
jgi:hypothetical protein